MAKKNLTDSVKSELQKSTGKYWVFGTIGVIIIVLLGLAAGGLI